MNTCLICTLLLAASPAAGREKAAPVTTFESNNKETGPQGRIDKLVFGKLKKLGIRRARVCSDAVFVRRVYLDATGTLPTAGEAREFIRNQAPDKRRALINRLLAREEYAGYWAMKWGDILRAKAEFPINLWPNGAQAYHRWVRTSLEDNMPYDRFARALLTSSGSNFRVPPVNFYRAMDGTDPETIARAVALTFMGARAENWPKKRLAGMAAFFSYVGYKKSKEWKEEIVFFDSVKAAEDAAAGKIPTAVFPDGTSVRLSPDRDPREVFADWLLAPNNPWFARNIVNRMWYWLQGRGIIHEPDDIRSDNPPSNPKLLAFLEKELVRSRYDLKHICRLILNSRTYQLSSIARTKDLRAEALFAYYPLRRLGAEVLADAVCGITGTTETYSSAIPEPFTFIPEGQRSIELPDGSISSSFLEMFGRPSRDTGLLSERNNNPSAAQRLHFLNSSHIRNKIERSGKLRALMQSSRKQVDVATRLYLTILSRFPTKKELEVVQEYARSGKVRGREAVVDLAWALFNSPEFLYRH